MDKKDPAIHRCIQCLYQLALIGMYDIRKRLAHSDFFSCFYQ